MSSGGNCYFEGKFDFLYANTDNHVSGYHGDGCPVNWDVLDKNIKYIAVGENCNLYGFSEKPEYVPMGYNNWTGKYVGDNPILITTLCDPEDSTPVIEQIWERPKK